MEFLKLDRSHFEILTFDEADRRINDHKDMQWKERLQLLIYLNGIAYGYAGHEEMPTMDKNAFEIRKFD